MQKKKITSSPRAASSTKSQKSVKHFFDSSKAPTDRFDEVTGLRQTIDLLIEEKQLLYEYKKTTVPKIQQLKDCLSKAELELQKKDSEIQKLKSFYESELACLQDYIDLLRNNGGKSELEDQLRSEKARSMTFYRALTRKQQECEQKHKEIEKVKLLESQISVMEQRLKEAVKGKEESAKEIRIKEAVKSKEASLANSEFSIKNLDSDSRGSSQSSEAMQEVMRKLKTEVKDRMKECIDQAVVNFGIFNSRIIKLEEKVMKAERFLQSNKNFDELKGALEEMKKEKLELQKTIEKNYKENIKDITSYEEEIERQKRKVKALLQELQDSKLTSESKLKKFVQENLEIKAKCEDLEKVIKKTENDQESFKRMKENELILKQVNEENAKLLEIVKELQRSLRENQQKVLLGKEEIVKLKADHDLSEKIIQDLKSSLANAEKILRSEFQRKESSYSVQEVTCDKTKSLSIEKVFYFSISQTFPLKTSTDIEKLLHEMQQEIETLKIQVNMEKQMRIKDSNLSESLLEENNIIQQEIDRLREEKNELVQENKALNSLVKKLQSDLENLTEEKQELEVDRSKVFKELKIANEVIFHNNKILDSSESFVVFESERENFLSEIQKIQRKFEETVEELNLEKIQHEETVKNLIQADKRIENLIVSLKKSQENLDQKEAEIEEFHEKIQALTEKFVELKKNYQAKLEKCEIVMSAFGEKEKIHLQDLNKIQHYEQVIRENEQNLEQKQENIEELQQLVEQYKLEIEKNSEKIRSLEQSLVKISKNLNENLELRRKIFDMGSPMKEQLSIDKTITEESSKEFTDFEKIRKNRSNLQDLLDKLVNLEESSESLSAKNRKILLEQLQGAMENQDLENLDEIKVKVNKLQAKIKELRGKYKVLIHKNETIGEENFYLREKLKNLTGEKSLDDNLGLDSLSLEEKQLSYIEIDEKNKVKYLEEENARLKYELDHLKDSTLGYSTSEDNTLSKPDDNISDTWIDKERNSVKLPPTLKKLVNKDENILILDNCDSISSESGISSPDVDISNELMFDSK